MTDQWISVWNGRDCLDPYLRAEAVKYPPRKPPPNDPNRKGPRIQGRTMTRRSVHKINKDRILEYLQDEVPVGEWCTAHEMVLHWGEGSAQAVGRPIAILIANGLVEARKHWAQNGQQVNVYRLVEGE